MKLKSAIRDPLTFKCAPPAETIAHIVQALEKLGFKLDYFQSQFSKKLNLFWGQAAIPSLRIKSNGKGITPELAKASAFAELIERISSGVFFRRDLLEAYATTALSKKFLAANHFTYLPGYVHAPQKAVTNPLRIEQLVAKRPPFSQDVLELLKQDDLCKHWVDGYSLLDEKTVKVPLEFIWAISRSNGLASGNTLEEAIVQATNEIFERHVCIKTLRERRVLPTIDLDSIENKRLRKIISQLEKLKIEVIVKDFSFNGLFPAIGVLFINHRLRKTKNPLLQLYQFRTFRIGSSFNAEEALLRCFTEQMQGKQLATFGSESNKCYLWSEFLEYFEPNFQPTILYRNLFRRYEFAGDLSFLEEGPVVPFHPLEPVYDCLLEIEKIKTISRQLQTDFIVVDHTHPLLNFPVARVIIPGFSDILPFFDFDLNEPPSLATLLSFLKNSDSFVIENKQYYLQSHWLTNAQELQSFAQRVLQHMLKTNQYTIGTIGLVNRPINALILLASVYYKLADFERLSVCLKTLATLYPAQKRQIVFWQLLAKFKQKEALAEEKEKLKAFGFSFLSEPFQNPLVGCTTEPPPESLEAHYLQAMEKLIDSFYIGTENR